ncbi:atp-dependent 6-phosphofructokinase [Lucifera butyrica]|uniref:Pyrophosphate--fructose 6-phosphate 1-phosphotransferase n=1 Tax=Lucifera butyrica TaxID=1351585 RepID=A0A498R9R6_9FIRM|nr:diphosphate--fructose-6-phosphate 1-phosphotransferase [Lucifera butyrica]VBB07735.1 atp-dependent 6-phosphofructokinase [Lucifera butyrica]
MSQTKSANLAVVHGGGPTSVLNASLYGVIEEAKKHGAISGILGAKGGIAGILKEQFIDFRKQSAENIERLPFTPASAIGTSRKELFEEDYENIVKILVKNNIKFLLFNGGNGSMDTCGKIYKAAKRFDINVIGIPKTIDNDIAITDHSPGFGSAARYIAASTAEVAEDVKAMPIHVCVIEAMGRNAGWITAASALARKNKEDAPHLIYLPERPFNQMEFLQDVKKLYDKLGGVVVVVSEGLKNEKGESIVPPLFTQGRSVYFGDVSAHLALMIVKELGIKARSEKPGIFGRASIAYQSFIDREEAKFAGVCAVKALLKGESGKMVGFSRVSNSPYKCNTILIPIEEVMMHEKKMPDNFINDRGNDITEAFIEYCQPLIGEALPQFTDFR